MTEQWNEQWIQQGTFWLCFVPELGGSVAICLEKLIDTELCRVTATRGSPLILLNSVADFLTRDEARLYSAALQEAAAIASDWSTYVEMMKGDSPPSKNVWVAVEGTGFRYQTSLESDRHSKGESRDG